MKFRVQCTKKILQPSTKVDLCFNLYSSSEYKHDKEPLGLLEFEATLADAAPFDVGKTVVMEIQVEENT